MFPQVSLTAPTRSDVERLMGWLTDDEVNTSWYGLGDDGQPLHAGYTPAHVLEGDSNDWNRVFNDDNRKVFAVYSSEGEHIGEAQLVIEWPLLEAQAFILVGRKDLWHHGYGTAAIRAALDEAFNEWGLFRVWVDVPEYNEAALRLFEHIGFVHEGTLRQSRSHEGSRFDSVVMGMLAAEYESLREEASSEHAAG